MTSLLNKVVCGNHLDILKRYPDGCFDMFLTSPPYDNLRDYEGYDFQFEPLAHELYRTLKSGGVGVWVVNDATVDGSETLTSFKQAIYFKDDVGFNVHDTMVYQKQNYVPQSHDRYEQCFEYAFILCKGKVLTFNPIKVKCVQKRKKRMLATHSVSTLERNSKTGLKRGHRYVSNEDKLKNNIWEYVVNHKTQDNIAFQHPAIFPEKLAEDHILSWSNPGDVILDPMCGSGTTCKMAAKHQRQYIGIDISEKYCELARERLDRFTKQTTIFEKVA